MTIVTAEKTWAWSPEVLALAKKLGVEAYLDPLMEATLEQFPDARAVRVEAWRDPELVDLQFVSFEVEVPMADLSTSNEVKDRWMDALARVCPMPHRMAITRVLIPVKP